MRIVRLYDPERRGNWNDELLPGEYPVLLRHGRTGAERNAEGHRLAPGEPSVCVVFPNLDEAKEYCQQKTAEVPDLQCDIYDAAGLSKPPQYTYGKTDWNPRPKVLLLLAAGFIIASFPLFWLDWRRRGILIFPSIIGINLFVVGLRFLFWWLGRTDQEGEKRKRNS